MPRPTESVNDQLEAMIDHSSLADIVSALSLIASEKAEHIRANWQDESTARPWQNACNILDIAAGRITV